MTAPCKSNDLLSAESNDHEYWGLSNTRSGGTTGCDEADTAPPASDLATFLSCHGNTAEELEGDGFERLDLKYDYEIHTSDGIDVEEAYSAFEVDLLRAFAEEHGLLSCFYGRRALRSGRTLDASNVIGVGSYPSDDIDPVHAECVVEVDFESSNCQPINGFMTAWTSSDRRRLSGEDLYSFVETYSNDYSTADVRGIRYIGTREAPVVDEATEELGYHDEPTSTGGLSPGAIAGIVVTSLLALLALLALVAKKVQERNRKQAQLREAQFVNNALFMMDIDDEIEVMKEASDTGSVQTEDHTFVGPNSTFGSDVKL
ncbi:hypothetical protein ACHAXT_008663 [Thalassiosira profunda]